MYIYRHCELVALSPGQLASDKYTKVVQRLSRHEEAQGSDVWAFWALEAQDDLN